MIIVRKYFTSEEDKPVTQKVEEERKKREKLIDSNLLGATGIGLGVTGIGVGSHKLGKWILEKAPAMANNGVYKPDLAAQRVIKSSKLVTPIGVGVALSSGSIYAARKLKKVANKNKGNERNEDKA